ncbi:PREDICTED: pathogenesis-related protein 5-like [Nicrophorus vespilloides]|uniref:Pathogenesis-related protein 5-like n=1 Tax=Nicrophorus vespilloides TaxID=110193 RepID=A0ABM1NIW7_NICVS|nr:PREDICTED: pathogenesis-related protein 5-like [Nicrophorus vespilloides]
MKMLFAVVAILLVASVQSVEFQIKNNLPGPIWVGILGNNGKPPLANGGFVLNQNEQKSVHSDERWAGRFWARTWCNPNSRHCETGDCGNRLECNGAGGVPPVTLAEITLRGHEGQDFYDISLVDGFNVVAKIQPLGGRGSCRTVGCNRDLNPNCPGPLRLTGSAGYTIACYSACSKFNTDQYCCRGQFGQPQSCNPATWQSNSASYFKSNCPDAYSYAYDDATSTFTCVANAYRVTFG